MTAPDPTAARTSSAAPGTLAAVLVCGGACCSGEGDHAVLDALAPLVRSTPHALLVRTTCLHPHDACPGDPGACAFGLQLCDAHLRPLSACRPLAGTARSAYRRVERWLDQTSPPLPEGGAPRP